MGTGASGASAKTAAEQLLETSFAAPCLVRENGAMAGSAIDLDGLSREEQLDLLERLWDRLSRRPEDVGVTDAQRRELDHRLAELDRDVAEGRDLGVPWDEVLRQIRSR